MLQPGPRTGNVEYLPDLDSLRCFITAAEQRHFRSAARAVGLSPAAFSDRIKRLELGLGASLFSRTTPTDGSSLRDSSISRLVTSRNLSASRK